MTAEKTSGHNVTRSSFSSSSRSSKVSSISSVRQKEEAERASLFARAASLKQQQALDIEECKLKAKREQLEIETAIAALTAKIKMLEACKYDNYKRDVFDCGASEEQLPGFQELSIQVPKVYCDHNEQVKGTDDTHQVDVSGVPINLCEVMLKQNDITEMLVRHLSQRDVSIFSGDPLEFIPFIRHFIVTLCLSLAVTMRCRTLINFRKGIIPLISE